MYINKMFKASLIYLSSLLVLIATVNGRDIPKYIEDPRLSRNVRAEGCQIKINGDLPEPQPILIVPGTEEFRLPLTREGIIYLEHGEQLELYCSLSFVEYTGVQSLVATCENDREFVVHGKYVPFNSLNCTSQAYHVARRSGKQCNEGAATHIEVGIEVGSRFLSFIDVCHDEQTEVTHYSHYHQKPNNMGFQSSFPRPAFITGGFFNNKNVDKLYTQVTQKETIGKILGTERASEVVLSTGDIYLARGHLAAKADFIYGSQQRGTFYFINTSPQWQKFNAANWESVEAGTRSFVANRNLEIEIYTGVYGVLELKDYNGNYQEIYLYFDENNNGQIPVPKLYYKLLIEPSTNLGIVLIGVNNPHATLEEIHESYVICTDISYMVTWLNWDKENILKGYSYACEVNEFLSVVGHLPSDIHASGLLF